MTGLLQTTIFLHFITVISASYNDAYELESRLFTNYSTRIRPVQNYSQPIKVSSSFQLLTIAGVDELHGQMTIIGVLTLNWTDEKLKWDPSEFGGIEYLHPYPKDVWLPRLQLANSLDDLDLFKDDYHFLVLRHTGQVTWAPGGLLPSLCLLNLKSFPFDEHPCQLIFRPIFTISANIVFSVSTREIVTEEIFEENGEWAVRRSGVDAPMQGNFVSAIIVNIAIKRRPEFFLMNFLIPVMLLSVLNLLSFTLVVNDGSVNISYSITVLLAYTIYMSILVDYLPSVSMNMPIISSYLFFLFVISLITTIDIIFIVWLNNKEEEEEKKQKMESKLKGAMKKLISLKGFARKQVGPSDNPSTTPTQISFMQLKNRATQNPVPPMRDSILDDTTSNNTYPPAFPMNTLAEDIGTSRDPLQTTSDNTYPTTKGDVDNNDAVNRPHRINRYKNLSEKVRKYSFYFFLVLNTLVTCGTLIRLTL